MEIECPFSEGVYVEYRWYDKEDIEPRFPFGHGLATLHSATEKSRQQLPIACLWLPHIQLGSLVSVAESTSTMK
jgi:hypothetical protein